MGHQIQAGEGCGAAARLFLPYAQEEFLVTLANKGLYKRAVKDYDAAQECSLALSDGQQLAVTIDGVTVQLDENLAKSRCSCPSKTVCKHVLMAVLCAAEYGAAQQEEPAAKPASDTAACTEAEPEPEPYLELRQADVASLRKQAGKRLFEDTLRLVQAGWTATFTEGEMLAATINTEAVTVYFPKQESLSHAVCKCGQQGLCKHKLIAVLSYLAQNGLLKESEGQSVSLLSEDALALLPKADQYLISLFEKGLLYCGESDIEQAIQLSLRLDSVGLGNLSRLMRSVATDLEHLLQKHAAFRSETAFATLSRLHNTISLLQKYPQDKEKLPALVEGGRSDYYTTPVGNFIGLGAYPWQTRSGYCGVTALLYSREKQQVYTYTASMADFYENTAQASSTWSLYHQFSRADHWAEGLSIQTIAGSCLTLRNFKSNLQGRLSSTKQTSCTITGPSNGGLLEELEKDGIFSAPEEGYTYFRRRQPERVYPFFTTHLAQTSFDKSEQVLRLLLENEREQFSCSILYKECNQWAIQFLERLARGKLPPCWFICIKQQGEMTPVSIITENAVNHFYFVDQNGVNRLV
ncbi:MAG: hypothetical protein HFG20_10220 [Anaerotruncus sp.]|nr:hypothetical protein [Anaerotruncus sp.]